MFSLCETNQIDLHDKSHNSSGECREDEIGNTACAPTCNSIYSPTICDPSQQQIGCVCKDPNMVYDSKGNCVLPEECKIAKYFWN